MNNGQLQNLMSCLLDGSIEPDDFHTLRATLNESASARRLYFAYKAVDDELYDLEADGEEYLQTLAIATISESGSFEHRDHDKSPGDKSSGQGVLIARSLIVRRKFFYFAIAAGLLVALAIWQRSDRPEQAHKTSTDEPAILAQIEPVSDACRWYVEDGHRERAESYRSGDIIRVTRGKLNLLYVSGTRVVLHSPAVYQLISGEDARILVGRLTATVSEAGIGFSVITPRATVVDLGTEFGVEVENNGATDVVVFNGEVDVDYHDDRINAQRLRMGEAIHLDAAGTASRIVSITTSAYSSQSLEEPSRPIVILQVRDNIRRNPSTLNYYEIVHSGMAEDASAYVDRISEYNGLTTEGMPPYLLGGDYVKTFNNDKANRNIRIRIDLARPANLYILLDDRVLPPEWLRDQFQDTGNNIGVERGGAILEDGRWRRTERPNGVGPGVAVGIVDTLSVWVCKVATPGVVTLGPPIIFDGDELFGVTSGNMYGIVAVPLGEAR